MQTTQDEAAEKMEFGEGGCNLIIIPPFSTCQP